MQRAVPKSQSRDASGDTQRAAQRPARDGGNKRGKSEQAPRLGRRERRRENLLAADWLLSNSQLPSVACCQLTPIDGAEGAVVKLGSAGTVASFGGLKRCGSPWSCPSCAARIGASRTDELAEAVRRWHAAGHSVAMVTLTMRHDRRDSLRELWDARTDAWSAVRQTKALREPGTRSPDGRALRAGALAGYVVKTEVTDGANGWHVHLHVLVFFRSGREAGGPALDAWKRKAWERWSTVLTRKGFAPAEGPGMQTTALFVPGNEADDVAAYVAKDGSPAEGLAAEVAAATGKIARHGNLSQWGTLGRAMAGDGAARARWTEWEAESKGRRQMVWTKALRAELLADVPELDDEALVAEDEDAEATPLLWLHGESFKLVRRLGRANDLLVAAEDGYALARHVHGFSHWDALQAAQDACTVVLGDAGVPDHHVLLRTLPGPPPPPPAPVEPAPVQLALA